jgi:phosphotransferase system IIB component
MNLYESCKTPIRVAYFGFILIAFGFFIQNESVNVFYTFRSNIILFLAELCLRIGEFIIMNLPLIFMLNIVCKKANNASPVVMALVGYFTFIVTTMLFSTQTLNAQAYASGYGINSIFNSSNGPRLPLETGMIGSFLVAYATRWSFILSRHRESYSLTNIFARDTSGLIYNFIFCFLLGLIVSYTFPFAYTYLQRAITFIGADLLDPMRIGLYSVLDRVLSILGLGNIIRYPFWYTSAGGSFSNTVTGQSVLGDVNIWTYIKDSNATYIGAGRFITPFYVINMFIIPGFYLGTLFSMSDRNDRGLLTFAILFAILLSIVAGNPLPTELLMLMTSPALLLVYLILVGFCSSGLVSFEAFLGFSSRISNTVIAMPGSFADFIINIRNSSLLPSIRIILIFGLAGFVFMLLFTMFYYRYLAFDFARSGNGEELVNDLIRIAGGTDNIISAGSGLFKLNVYIRDPEKISFEKIQEIGIRKVVETRNGLTFELGTSCNAIARRINRRLIK